MLVYLNETTFAGEAGQVLAEEVRLAQGEGMQIVLAHENDQDRQGCQFSRCTCGCTLDCIVQGASAPELHSISLARRFFETTPEDLVRGGLYEKIAVAFHPGDHRKVSVALLAKELGAVQRRGKAAEAAVRAYGSFTRKNRADGPPVGVFIQDGLRRVERSRQEEPPGLI